MTKIIKFLLGSSMIAFSPLHALTTLTVNTTTDINPTGFGVGSGTSGDLRWCLNTLNSTVDDYNIQFGVAPGTITISGMLPIINLNNANIVTIDGTSGAGQMTISGNNLYPGFVVRQGTVSLTNMTIQNTLSQGGTGGGGGLGAGGGLFLIGGTTTISNLTFTGNRAIGGSNSNSGGGGMFRGNSQSLAGGGMSGRGGTGGSGSAGGGIGTGSASDTVGQGGTAGNNAGFDGNGWGASRGGTSATNLGGLNAGGGGGGLTFGGAGGGINGTQTVVTTAGGAGGFAGGGGAGIADNGGSGGFGAGGAGSTTNGTICGSGGFGGGGGGSNTASTATPGAGGFGAGGGTSSSGALIGAAGVGGGLGTTTGGAALGGAIFVNTSTNASYYNGGAGGGGGAQLVIVGTPPSISGTSLTGGGSGTGLGAAVGQHIFATTGSDAITFNVASGTGTYSGTIYDDSSYSLPGGTYQAGFLSGAPVNKEGSGTLVLTGTNGYSGGTNLNAGTLGVGSNSCLGNPASALTFAGSATETLQAAASITLPNPIVTNSETNQFDSNGFTLVLSGAITGPGTVNKIGTGIVSLTSSGNTYSGNTVVQGGAGSILSISGSGTVPSTGTVFVDTDATFQISGISATSLTIAGLTGTGFVNLGSKELVVNVATSDTFDGVISGVGGQFTKDGAGTFTFTNANTYTGLTTIDNGTLVIDTGSLDPTGGILINSPGVLFINQVESSGTYAGDITGDGSLVASGGTSTNPSAIQLTGTNLYTGGTTIQSNTVLYGTTTSIQGDIANSGIVDFEGTGTYSDVISGTGITLINDYGGSGTITFDNVQAYTLRTSIANGTLALSGSGDISSASQLEMAASATFNISGITNTSTTVGELLGSGTIQLGSKTLITSTATDPVSYGGVLVGSGFSGFRKQGGGKLILTQPSPAFLGTATISAGTLEINPDTLSASAGIINNSVLNFEQTTGSATYPGPISGTGILNVNTEGGTGTVELTGALSYTGVTNVKAGSLAINQSAANTLTGDFALSNGATVDYDQAAATIGTYSGTISGLGGVDVNRLLNTGTVILSGLKSYTGPTHLYAGTLEMLNATDQTIASQFTLDSGSLLDIEQVSGTGSFSGNISGAGSVEVNSGGNTGTVVFEGVNSYTGGTLVSNGTLRGNTNSLVGTITDNANVEFSQAFNGSFNGTFLGTGIIKISGLGRVSFDASSPLFAGTTNVDAGRLALNASLGGNVFVKALGFLSGNGTVLGNLTIEDKGTVRPGNSIGTINVIGNYLQNSGSIYDVQIDSVGNSSLINVSGQATLANGSKLVVTAIDGVPGLNTIYTILYANAGVNGTYSTVFFDNDLVIPVVTYDSQHVYLELYVDFDKIALTYNQKQVATQLASLGADASPELKAILGQLISVPLDESRQALSQMSAEQYTNVIMTAELANRQFIRRLYDPLRTIITTNPCKRSTECCYIQPYDTWFAISGGRTFIHGNENARGFRIADYEICGGGQVTLKKRWTLGVALSYERDTIKYKVGGAGTCDTVLSAVYGLYRNKRFYALADGIIGYSNDKVRRTIDVGTLHYKPKGNPKVYQGSIYTELGTDFAFSNTLIQPFVGIEWGYYRYNSFREHGGSPLNVRVFQKSLSNAYSRLGLHVTSPPLSCGFSMNIDLAWQYRLTPLRNKINLEFLDFGSKFNILGLPLNRNSYEGIVRFAQTVYKSWEAYFEGTCQGWDNSTAYSFVGGIRTTW